MEIPDEMRAAMPAGMADVLASCETAMFAVVGFAPDGQSLLPHAWFAPELDQATGALLLNKLAFRYENPDMAEPRALITASIANVPGLTGDNNACVKLSGDIDQLGAAGVIGALLQLASITAQRAGIPVKIDHAWSHGDAKPDESGAYL